MGERPLYYLLLTRLRFRDMKAGTVADGGSVLYMVLG